MPRGNGDQPPPRRFGGSKTTWTDGGVASESTSLAESLSYSRSLQRLTAAERRTAEDDSNLDPESLAEAVSSFLSSTDTGSAYRSGVRMATQVAARGGLTATRFVDVDIGLSPEAELFDWVLANNAGESPELSAEAFEFCLGRREWRRLLLDLVSRDRDGVALTDEQLVTLVTPRDRPTHPLVDTLVARGLTEEAEEFLTTYFDASVDRRETAALLSTAADLGFEEEVRTRLRVSLHRWRSDDSVAELKRLVRLGRSYDRHDAVLRAVDRCLRNAGWETVPAEHQELVTGAVDALIHRDGHGVDDALILYRTHLYPADSLHDIAPDLYDAAEAAGDEDIVQDVLSAYDVTTEVTDDDVRDAVLAARVMERRGQWEEAYETWTQILEEAPTDERYEQAIDNRLQVLRLEDAESLIDEFEAFTDTAAVPVAYRVRVADERGEYRRVVDLVDSTPAVLELPEEYTRPVTRAYVESLSDLGRWSELGSFLEDADGLDTDFERFYLSVANLMRFADGAADAIDGQAAVDTAEQLLTAPLTTRQLVLVLNLGVVGQVADEIRASHSELTDRLDVIEGLVEILVSLHAERMIDLLRDHGVGTDDYEEMLADFDLRRGGRQLLSSLNREIRREGIT
jgi:tetratricopeptide (TPR) repeat protein